MWRRSLLLLLAFNAACGEYVVPAQEISRRSIDLAAAISELLDKDDICGFESPAVRAGQKIEGNIGEVGVAIRTVEDCDLDAVYAKKRTPLLFGCEGDGEVGGYVRVSAERRIVGLIVDAEDPDEQLIAASPDAKTIELRDAELTDFSIREEDKPNYITVREGTLSGFIAPKLAEDGRGLCAAPTRHAGFQAINLSRAMLRFVAGDGEFNAIVQGSNLNAARGEYGENKNVLQGEIAVNGTRQRIPVSVDDLALDPNYLEDSFDETFTCAKNSALAVPLAYECRGNGTVAVDVGAAVDNLGRLSVRGFAQIVARLGEDASCGFANSSVKQNAQVSGPIGGDGSVTFTADRCLLELPPNTLFSSDCTGGQSFAGGKVWVSAKKTVRGRLTGDLAGDPVVPLTEDAATIEVTEMRFENFSLTQGDSTVLWNSGILRGKLSPRLAYDTETTACSFATDIVRFENLAYENTSVVVTQGEERQEATINSSLFSATSGLWGEKENYLAGTISLEGDQYVIGGELNQTKLDPDYDRAAFDRAWQCGTVELPVTYTCNIDDRLSEAAARMAILALANVARAVDDNQQCGFLNPAVKSAGVVTGAVGDAGGAVTQQVTACQISWPALTPLTTDCNAETTKVQGTVTVTGTKRISGWVTGAADQPIIPMQRDAVELDLDIELNNFKVILGNSPDNLTIRSGRLRGKLRPRAAYSRTDQVCSLGTPVVTFEDVTWQNAAVSANYQNKRFDALVSTSALSAQNGNKDGRENQLSGSLILDGKTWVTPSDLVLDPNYDRAVFENSYASCKPDMQIPPSDALCDFRPQLAEHAARAIVFATASAASLIQNNQNCGFSNSDIQEDPIRVTGDEGDYGTMEFAVNNCSMSFGSSSASDTSGNIYDYAQRMKQDCRNRSTYVKGRVTVSGTEIVEGERDEIWFTDVIYPLKPNSVTMNLNQVTFQDFTVFDRELNATPLARVIIRSGTLSGVVYPMTGARADQRAEYSVATPVAKMERLALTNAQVTLIDDDGKNFNFTINSSDLAAYNGMYNNDGNRLSGSITIGGQAITLAPAAFDSAYNQADFDQRYACTSNLYQTLPPNSSVGHP